MSEIPPVNLPHQPLPQEKKLREDGQHKRGDGRPSPREKKPPSDDPQHIDEYA